jgi:hypothetical protein
MSSQITTAFVKQYHDMIFHLVQQKGSRLRPAVRVETQKGESAFYERLGSVTAVKKTSRHADTPLIDTPHSRRRVTLEDYEYADLIDHQDKLRMLLDPQSAYAQAQMWAHGRSMDDAIIAAISGNAYSGSDGGTTVALGNAQKIASVASSAGANLNVSALRNAKDILDSADVDPSIPRYCVLNSSALNLGLLAQTEVTSSDFNTVKALVQGELDTYLGFKFIRTERLVAQSGALSFNTTSGAVGSGGGDADGYFKMLCFAGDGILFALADDMEVKIDERADKSYATQVYSRSSFGATRLEEQKVVEILCAQ